MSHPWAAEQTIEPAAALRLIQEQFPEIQAKKIRLLGVGWDNTAFVINEELVFRFPRREIALPLLETEWLLLPALASRLPLPIPVPQWRGCPCASFPWPFIGYRMLAGFTACYANLLEEERAALAQPIACFLSALHATPQAQIAQCKVTGDNQSRIDGALLTSKIKKNFDELDLLGLLPNRKSLEKLVEESQDFRTPKQSCIVHGDFYVRHLLIDEKHRLVGVIDWGDVHLGDPAIDLAIAHSFLPKSAHSSFIKSYGEVDLKTWHLARLRAIFSSTYLILFGHHSNDPDIFREGIRALGAMS